MPVEDHAVHKKVQIDASKPYGCHNRKEFSEIYYAPNRKMGSSGYEPIFFFERVRIPHRMSRECRYDMSLNDARCAGCKHRGSGEKYSERVRAAGA